MSIETEELSDRISAIDGGSFDSIYQETSRLIENQTQVIHEQHVQAARILKVALTVGGLLLTTFSIAVSLFSAPASAVLTPLLDQFSFTTLFLVGLIISLIFGTILVFMFYNSLLVLSPDNEGPVQSLMHAYIGFLRSIAPGDSLPSAYERLDERYKNPEINSIKLGPNIDTLVDIANCNQNMAINKIAKEHFSCIQQNQQIIEANRRRLSTVYSSGTLAGFLLLMGIVLTIQIFILSI